MSLAQAYFRFTFKSIISSNFGPTRQESGTRKAIFQKKRTYSTSQRYKRLHQINAMNVQKVTKNNVARMTEFSIFACKKLVELLKTMALHLVQSL